MIETEWCWNFILELIILLRENISNSNHFEWFLSQCFVTLIYVEDQICTWKALDHVICHSTPTFCHPDRDCGTNTKSLSSSDTKCNIQYVVEKLATVMLVTSWRWPFQDVGCRIIAKMSPTSTVSNIRHRNWSNRLVTNIESLVTRVWFIPYMK